MIVVREATSLITWPYWTQSPVFTGDDFTRADSKTRGQAGRFLGYRTLAIPASSNLLEPVDAQDLLPAIATDAFRG